MTLLRFTELVKQKHTHLFNAPLPEHKDSLVLSNILEISEIMRKDNVTGELGCW